VAERSGSKEPYEVDDVRIRSETQAALLVAVGKRLIWVPKSQVLEGSEVWAEGDEGTLVIPEWLAIERGID
jgi:hypothetical protein